MRQGKTCRRGAAAALSGILYLTGLSADSLPVSGQRPQADATAYTLTETQDGWRYVDRNGNYLKEQLIPYRNLQPRTGASAAGETFPSRYDMREEGLITGVKQQVGGTCWLYASVGAIESNMIRKGMGDSLLDLSEAHLVWFARGQGSPPDPSHPLYGDAANRGVTGYEEGGNIYNVTATLAAWQGVVSENAVPSHASKTPLDESLRFKSEAHLQHTRKYASNDFNGIKTCLLEKGALHLSYFVMHQPECLSEQYGYYQTYYVAGAKNDPNLDGGGHGVLLVGWDDNFPKENFIETPPGDGAWIIRNSWGENASRTEKGFFYLSYYDKSITDIYLYDMEPADNYSGIYQYDGDSSRSYTTGFGADTGFIQANVFQAKQDENITAIGFYTNDVSMPYEAQIYALNEDFADPRDGRLLTEISGEEEYIGYHTVKLPPGCGVRKGQQFSVVIRTAPRKGTTCHFDMHCFAPRTSYFTVYNAEEEEPWKDCYYDGRGNVNVKAFTTYGLGLNETLCPDPLIRGHLSEQFDSNDDLIVTPEEFRAVSDRIPYDVNGDRLVDARELTLLKRAALGEQQSAAGLQWYYGDWNSDLILDAEDVSFLADYLCQRPRSK
ncbi:MAG: hypothetical protein IJL32_03245 [Oscillospiraceae bacterium]|nr:hypothetical protein [Oscillospiraceae bacterium]